MTLIELAAQQRARVNYPAYSDSLDAHTNGLAEMVAALTGRLYSEVRVEIVERSADYDVYGNLTDEAKQVQDECRFWEMHYRLAQSQGRDSI